MKHIEKLIIGLLMLSIGLASCNSSDKGNLPELGDGVEGDIASIKQAINGRWVLDNTESIKELEFSLGGQYKLVDGKDVAYQGEYTLKELQELKIHISDKRKLELNLSGFGKLVLRGLEKNKMQFDYAGKNYISKFANKSGAVSLITTHNSVDNKTIVYLTNVLGEEKKEILSVSKNIELIGWNQLFQTAYFAEKDENMDIMRVHSLQLGEEQLKEIAHTGATLDTYISGNGEIIIYNTETEWKQIEVKSKNEIKLLDLKDTDQYIVGDVSVDGKKAIVIEDTGVMYLLEDGNLKLMKAPNVLDGRISADMKNIAMVIKVNDRDALATCEIDGKNYKELHTAAEFVSIENIDWGIDGSIYIEQHNYKTSVFDNYRMVNGKIEKLGTGFAKMTDAKYISVTINE